MPTVLIVDDEPDVQMFLRVVLETAGFVTISAANGREALDAIAAREPDVVLLDIMMPVLDGWAALEVLEQGGVRPPVIVMTAKIDADTRRRAREMGVEDFVSKPFAPGEMLERVEDVLRHARNPLAIRLVPPHPSTQAVPALAP
jgi:DNA-binding response OmpR family regulator